MSLKSLAVEAITAESFAPFGTLVDWTPELEQTGQPAIRAIEQMENHPQSEELFAPVQGRSILVVAEKGEFDEDTIHAFFLDRPVSVGPGVWHGVFALLIAENLEVGAEYAELSAPVGATLG